VSAAATIVSYRTGPALEACLAALVKAGGLSEIVIVDNGNPEPAQAAIDAFAAANASVRVLRGQGNIGFAAANNRGARAAQSPLLAFINPDVILNADAITRLSAALETSAGPALIGGDLRDDRGKPERGSRRDRLTLWRAFVSFTGLSRFERLAPPLRDFNRHTRHTDPLPAQPTPVGAVSGALMLVRRADFEALGGFDEGYFLHVEDIDLCRRAGRRAGAWCSRRAPTACICAPPATLTPLRSAVIRRAAWRAISASFRTARSSACLRRLRARSSSPLRRAGSAREQARDCLRRRRRGRRSGGACVDRVWMDGHRFDAHRS
jgi:GT2 family glycosyltransferase